MIRLKLAAVWVMLQILFFAGWAIREESRLAVGEGRSILVRTVPVDPRDLISGQYIRLAYEFSTGRTLADLDVRFRDGPPSGSTIWVVLGPEEEFYVPVSVHDERPERLEPAQLALRGTVSGSMLRFGIERYFVQEGTETPDPRDITVGLRVGDDGLPRIETVFVRGIAWP